MERRLIPEWKRSVVPFRCVRSVSDGRNKSFWIPQSVNELYDLNSYPAEMVNLINSLAGTHQAYRLWKELADWMIQTVVPLRKSYKELLPWGTIASTGHIGP